MRHSVTDGHWPARGASKGSDGPFLGLHAIIWKIIAKFEMRQIVMLTNSIWDTLIANFINFFNNSTEF